MDIKKFDVLLKKISMLKQNIDLTGEDISPLEVELLKNYTKRLYVAITEEELLEKRSKDKKKKKKKKIKFHDIANESMEGDDREEAGIDPEIEKTQEEVIVNEEAIQTEDESEEKIEFDEVLLSLFEGSSSSELSEKLSALPIKDMTKAMGINDRIFTINELFGSDKKLFHDTMEKLNGFGSYEEAKDYLLHHVAVKFDWAKAENHKKVKRFIKLVQRRYA